MAETHIAQEAHIKAQVFDAITRLKSPQPPGKILAALQDVPVFKQVEYAALILFQPTLATEDREAKIDFEAEMQPNLSNVVEHLPFDQDAILTERPLHPSEYPPLPADHRRWEAGR